MIELRVAIVGAEEASWPKGSDEVVKPIIVRILRKYPFLMLVSGGCPKGGVDIWAEEVADSMSIPKKIFKPEVHSWNHPRGYKWRNQQIAIFCAELYDIEPYGKRSGGTWTAEFVRKLGKYAELVEVEF